MTNNPYFDGLRVALGLDLMVYGFSEGELDAVYERLTRDPEQGRLICESADFDELDLHYNDGEEIDDLILESIRIKRYGQAESKMKALVRTFNKFSRGGITALDAVIGRPRKTGLFATVTVRVPLSDGQAVTIVFHSPGGESDMKIAADDEIIAFRWLLNKRDITHVVSPERGRDVTLEQVATRIMQVAAKNTDAFQRQQVEATQEAEKLSETEKLVDEKKLANMATLDEISGVQSDFIRANESVTALAETVAELRQTNDDLQARIDAMKTQQQEAAAAKAAEEEAARIRDAEKAAVEPVEGGDENGSRPDPDTMQAGEPPETVEGQTVEPEKVTYGTFVEWENALTELVEARMEVTRSDAQGIVEVKQAHLGAAYESGTTPEEAYEAFWGQPKESPDVPIAPSNQQADGNPAKRAAKLLIGLGLAEKAVVPGLYRKVKSGAYEDLIIETHPTDRADATSIVLTQYFEQNGDRIIDGEMIFVVNRKVGQLKLAEIAYQGPFGEIRRRNIGRPERSWANTFSKGLMDQGFDAGEAVDPKTEIGVDGEVIQGGKFAGFKLVAQSDLGVNSPLVNVYGLNGKTIGVVHRDDIEMFKGGNGKALQPVGGWKNEFSNELKEKLGLTGHEIPEPEPEPPNPDFEEMVATAARWKGATMQVAKIVQNDKQKALQLSRMTTKGDLDAYLMARYGIDEASARDVSNTLTERNIPANMNANLDEFASEPWADLALQADGPCDSCGADAADCRCGDYVNSGPMPEWMKAKFDEMPNPAASDDEPFFQSVKFKGDEKAARFYAQTELEKYNRANEPEPEPEPEPDAPPAVTVANDVLAGKYDHLDPSALADLLEPVFELDEAVYLDLMEKVDAYATAHTRKAAEAA